MNAVRTGRSVVFSIGCLALGIVGLLRVAPLASQGSLNKTQFEYPVIEAPPDRRSIQAALDEYVYSKWELAAFEMGELQAPRLLFKKAGRSVS